MSWDEVKIRTEDNGGENAETILARIDERVKNMNEKLVMHIVSFEEHRKEDDKNFGGLYKTVYTGVGIALAIEFVVTVFKH